MSDQRKHLTETGMSKGYDPDLPAYTREPAGPPAERRNEPDDPEPTTDPSD